MNKRVKHCVFLLVSICLFFLGCNADLQQIDTQRWSEEDSVLAVLEDSYLVSDYESRVQGNYLLFRYYPEEGRSEDLGLIPNFLMTYARPVLIDEQFYMFISSVSGTEVQQYLYCIDLSVNHLEKVILHPDNYPLSPVAKFADNIAFLGVEQNSDGSLFSRIYYQKITSDEYTMVVEKHYSSDSIGEAMVHLSASGDTIYTLTRVASATTDSYAVDVFDKSFTQTQRLFLSQDFTEIQKNQKITKFEVFGDYVFIRTPEIGYIGRMTKDGVEVLMSHAMLDMAYNPSYCYKDECTFYLMREAVWYTLHMDTGQIEEQAWHLGEDRIIQHIEACDNGLLFKSYKNDQGNISEPRWTFLPKAALSSLAPC